MSSKGVKFQQMLEELISHGKCIFLHSLGYLGSFADWKMYEPTPSSEILMVFTQ